LNEQIPVLFPSFPPSAAVEGTFFPRPFEGAFTAEPASFPASIESDHSFLASSVSAAFQRAFSAAFTATELEEPTSLSFLASIPAALEPGSF
jgi:hypothetical protein